MYKYDDHSSSEVFLEYGLNRWKSNHNRSHTHKHTREWLFGMYCIYILAAHYSMGHMIQYILLKKAISNYAIVWLVLVAVNFAHIHQSYFTYNDQYYALSTSRSIISPEN